MLFASGVIEAKMQNCNKNYIQQYENRIKHNDLIVTKPKQSTSFQCFFVILWTIAKQTMIKSVKNL
jgi:hypothetical protein